MQLRVPTRADQARASTSHRSILVRRLMLGAFALLAMLVPAVSDFDIALGRTNAIQG